MPAQLVFDHGCCEPVRARSVSYGDLLEVSLDTQITLATSGNDQDSEASVTSATLGWHGDQPTPVHPRGVDGGSWGLKLHWRELP